MVGMRPVTTRNTERSRRSLLRGMAARGRGRGRGRGLGRDRLKPTNRRLSAASIVIQVNCFITMFLLKAAVMQTSQ